MTSSSDALVVERALDVVKARPNGIVAVVGPTATGKTALAIALAERLGGEVIGADSVQIYKGFDIGSGKPSSADLARAPHHLVSAFDPMDSMDAASWADHASRTLEEVRSRGALPIVCGGTFLWVKALLYGLAEVPAANHRVRAVHRSVVEEQGRPALHARLRALDPDSAKRLHPNDFVRVSRALEVSELTGRPMSEWQREHGFARPLREASLLAPTCSAAERDASIVERVDKWLALGWVEEVEALSARGYDGARAMRSVGYAQVRSMLSGTLPREQLRTAIVRATRVFARRQRTWLNHADVTWL